MTMTAPRETRAAYRARRDAIRAELPGGFDELRALNEQLTDPTDPRGDDPAWVDAIDAEFRSRKAAHNWWQRQSKATRRRLADTPEETRMADRTPYDADHIAYVHEAGEVTALYIPDPDHAADPKGTWAKCRDLSWWRTSGVVVIGSVVRYGRRWYWESGEGRDPFPDGDPTTKRDAMAGLKKAVALHFERVANHNTKENQ